MTHTERDQDLLMLAHGQIDLPRRLLLRAHLLRCDGCRDRLAELETVSRRIAIAVRPQAMPRWEPPNAGAGALRLLTATVLVAAVLLSVALWESVHARHSTPLRLSQPCVPGLPSDRCR